MRGEWGFDGMVISDAGAVDGIWGCDDPGRVVHDRACHNYTHTAQDATTAALKAGCDLDYGQAYSGHLQAAVRGGAVTVAEVANSVKNVFRTRLRTMIEPGLTDPATIPAGHNAYADIPFSVVDSAEHRALARDAAAAAAVLLTNHEETLPLPLQEGGSATARTVTVALIGEHTGGDWTSPITDGCFHLDPQHPTECSPFWQVVPGEILGGAYRGTPAKIDSLLESFQRRARAGSAGLRVVHAVGVQTGCKAHACEGAVCPPFSASCASRSGTVNQTARIQAAAAAAAGADFVVVTLVPSQGGESHDRQAINLPAAQAAMLAAVAAACRSPRRAKGRAGTGVGAGCRLVSVLFGDGSLTDERIWNHSDAVLHGGMAGQGGGEAMASLLLGERNPSGALPMTIYHEGFSAVNNFTDHSFTAPPGRGARFLTQPPAFPFGHSLSYTSWAETAASLSARSVRASSAAGLTVNVTVTNTGARAGDRAVLLSLRRKEAAPNGRRGGGVWPLRWLVDFAKLRGVEPGESRNVSLRVTAEEGWRQWASAEAEAAGEFELLLGASNKAERLAFRVVV